MQRRAFLGVIGGVPFVFAGYAARGDGLVAQGTGAAKQFEVTKSKDEWRKILTPEQFRILREHDTERPGSSSLNNEKRAGTYHCAGCDLPVYSSEAKYDSRTGWPSYYAAIPNGVGTSVDRSLSEVRTEVHCRRCGGHLGHVFDDGPAPTGKRHCINGAAMVFKANTSGGR